MSSTVGDQQRNGEHKEWHNNGQIEVHKFYKDGELEGEYKRWYANGQLQVHTFFENGNPEGDYKYWCSNGHREVHIFFKNGQREGECKSYSSGQLQFYEYYMNGDVIDEKFTVHKKHIWIRYFQRLRYRINLRRLAVILDEFLIPDLIKICAKY